MMKKYLILKSMTALSVLAAVFSAGCMKLKTENQVEVKPIHITIDINLKVDKALDDFFGDIDEKQEKNN